MLSKVLIIAMALLTMGIKSDLSTMLPTKPEKPLQKCLSEIIRHYCLKPEFCLNGILTNYYNLQQEKILKMYINLDKPRLSYISYCPNIGLFDVRSSNLDLQITDRCRKTLSMFLFKTIDLTYFLNRDYLFMDTAYLLDEKENLYVFEPYLNGNASRTDFFPVLLGKCENARNQFPDFKFFRYQRKWPNTSIRIVFRDIPPFVDSKGTGVEQSILRIVLEHLDIKNTSRIDYGYWLNDKNDSTGDYVDKALLDLQHNKADVVVGGFQQTEETGKDFEGSFIYFIDSLNIIAPKSALKPIWLRVFKIYSWQFSLALIISLIILLVFIYYFYDIHNFKVLLNFFQIFIDSPVNNMQKIFTFRVVTAFLLIFCLVHSTAFKNALMIIYFSKEYHDEIYTKEDIIDSGLKLYVYSAKRIERYKNSNSELNRELATRMDVCYDIDVCLQRVASKKDHAIIFLKIPTIYATPQHFKDPETDELLLHIGDSLTMVSYQMLFRKNYPPFADIDDVLTRVGETGLYNFEEKKKIFGWFLSSLPKAKLDEPALTFRHVEFVFLIWIVGLFFATVTFLGELIKHYYF